MDKTFNELLRQWRQERRYSQLQLAIELGISARHLSFLETGRAKPSRAMILKIARFLAAPKSAVNQALLASGFAPIYVGAEQNSSHLKPALDAIELMLTKHLPYPALVFNADYDIIKANSAAYQLLGGLAYKSQNFVEILLEDYQQKYTIINWQEIALHTYHRIQQDRLTHAYSTRLELLSAELYKLLQHEKNSNNPSQHPIILSTRLKLGAVDFSFFSVVAQLSSIQDLELSEYKIELLFPSDEATRLHYSNKADCR